MSDLIERQVAIDAAIEAVDEWDGGCSPTRADMIADAINNTVPSAQPEQHDIGYFECANVMLKMWNDNILTNGEYKHIMSKLNAHLTERREE